MSGPPHQFPTGFPNPQQPGMRSQFGPGQMSGPMGPGMQSPLGGHMQMGGNQMSTGSINNGMGGQMPPGMAGTGMCPPMHCPMDSPQPYRMGGPGMPSQHAQLQQMQLQQLQVQQAQQQQAVVQQQQKVQQQVQQQVAQPTQQVVQQVVQQQPPTNTTPNTSATPTPPAPQTASQNKEFNTVSLCRFGQETVQDIVSRTQEVFGALKIIQPPNGTLPGSTNSSEKKAKVQEQLRTIRLLFKRLRLIYEKCNESCQLQGMEYTHIESLIPYKDELDIKSDEKKTSEAYRAVVEEHKELNEQVVLKNRQLKEILDGARHAGNILTLKRYSSRSPSPESILTFKHNRYPSPKDP